MSRRSAACASGGRRAPRVSPAQAQRDGLADLDRTYPAAQRHADEEVLKLLGLLEPSVDLRHVSATVFGQGVAGYYDPRTKRLRIVRGAQTTNRFLEEITLAHELTHALEDQRFGLDLEDTSGSDDAALARLALVEGSATAVMFTYAERHFTSDQTLGGLFASLGQDTGDLPPFVEAQLLFPYLAGQRFVQELYRTGDNGWSVLNTADRFRPPASTEQVLHPQKYIAVEQPDRVRLRIRRRAGAGWHRLAAGTWGEWATGELIGNPGRRRAGAATATSSGSSPAAPARRRAGSATRSSCAGAGTRPRDAREFADRPPRVARPAAGPERNRRRTAATSRSPSLPTPGSHAAWPGAGPLQDRRRSTDPRFPR